MVKTWTTCALTAALCVVVSTAPSVAAAYGPPNVSFVYVSDVSGTRDVYARDLDGTTILQLTHDPAADFGPAVSPDGSQVAFWSTRDGSTQLYVMDIDGSDQRRLTTHVQADNPHERFPPSWSPDGSLIAYESNHDHPATCNCTNIYVIRPDGSGNRRITTAAGIDAGPTWSPDGRRLAFARQDLSVTAYPEIWVATVLGRPRESRVTYTDAYEWGPAWSPSGGRILFASNRAHGGAEGSLSLYSMRPDGSRVRRLTRSEGWDMKASWSPDGRWILFSRDPDGPASGLGCFTVPPGCHAQIGPAGADIWIVGNGRTGGARPLTTTTESESDPAFVPALAPRA